MAVTDGVQWHVVEGGQVQTQILGPGNTGFQDIWEVTYQVDSGPAVGTTGVVRIPVAQYNAGTVEMTIANQIHHLHEIASL